MAKSLHNSVSLFFYAGDFADAWRRHENGEHPVYATHTEIVKLLKEFEDDGIEPTVYSFVTPEAKIETLGRNIRIISLGAGNWSRADLLIKALNSDTSTALIPHFPNPGLVKACIASGRSLMVGMANSYNRRSPKATWERWSLARLLDDPRITLVTNHCWPSTQKLAEYGVSREKLVAWDIPHAHSPSSFPSKVFPTSEEFTIAYAGSIALSKGVGEIIEAVEHLNSEGIKVRAVFAGKGGIETMRALADRHRVTGEVEFLGLIDNEEVVKLFRNADLVCIPSRHDFPEGFPLTMFEAIASRTPVICSDHPMFVPVMGKGERAEVFRAADAHALAAAVKRAMSEKDHYERLSRNAETSWAALQGTADWRTLIGRWVRHGADDPWIRQHRLAAREGQ